MNIFCRYTHLSRLHNLTEPSCAHDAILTDASSMDNVEWGWNTMAPTFTLWPVIKDLLFENCTLVMIQYIRALHREFKHGGPPSLIFWPHAWILEFSSYLCLTTMFEFLRSARLLDFKLLYHLPTSYNLMLWRTLHMTELLLISHIQLYYRVKKLLGNNPLQF